MKDMLMMAGLMFLTGGMGFVMYEFAYHLAGGGWMGRLSGISAALTLALGVYRAVDLATMDDRDSKWPW
jgi:hypothetical protein